VSGGRRLVRRPHRIGNLSSVRNGVRVVRSFSASVWALLVAGLLVAGCQTTPTNGGNGSQDSVTDAQQTAAEDAAAAAMAVGQTGQVVAPLQEAALQNSASPSSRQLVNPPTAAELQTRLEANLVSGAVSVTKTSALSYRITFNEAVFVQDGLGINGTVTLSVDLLQQALTITSQDLRIGGVTVVGTITAKRPSENTLQMSASVTTTVPWGSGTRTLSVTLRGVANEEFATAVWADDQATINGVMTVDSTTADPVTVTLTNLVLATTSVYPTSGTISFTLGTEELTVTFNGTNSVTLSDGDGNTATLTLPPLV